MVPVKRIKSIFVDQMDSETRLRTPFHYLKYSFHFLNKTNLKWYLLTYVQKMLRFWKVTSENLEIGKTFPNPSNFKISGVICKQI